MLNRYTTGSVFNQAGESLPYALKRVNTRSALKTRVGSAGGPIGIERATRLAVEREASAPRLRFPYGSVRVGASGGDCLT